MIDIDETETDEIQVDVADIQDTIRDETVDSILIDLAEFLGDNPAEDAGLRAAIEIIKANYGR